jgi:aminomethyltransferase
MGEVVVRGPAALEFLNHTLTNDLRKLVVGQGQYTLMCHEGGGVLDDLYVYRTDEQDFLLIINASRIDADVPWLEKQWNAWPHRAQVLLTNASDRLAAVALQGPRVAEFVDVCFPGPSVQGTPVARASELKKNRLGVFQRDGAELYVARTGYTGEDGFEAVLLAEKVEGLWNHILAVGHAYCLQPAGLGARDTLRTEVCYPLYGHELDEKTTPLEAGLGTFVALDKPAFVGRAALAEQKANGISKKCVPFKMGEKTPPPRPQYPIWSTGAGAAKMGQVVSGTQSPSLGIGIGMGYVPPSLAAPGTAIEIEVRGKRAPAVIVTKPIYRKPGL